jgi:DNA-binding transcriptional ArsR family regulator
MLTALMGGKALTASELAEEGGVTPQTASSHLSKLDQGGLVRPRRQGRHKYFPSPMTMSPAFSKG